MTREECGERYGRHPARPHLTAICTRPPGHDGDHSNVMHKPGEDPDRDAAAQTHPQPIPKPDATR